MICDRDKESWKFIFMLHKNHAHVTNYHEYLSFFCSSQSIMAHWITRDRKWISQFFFAAVKIYPLFFTFACSHSVKSLLEKKNPLERKRKYLRMKKNKLSVLGWGSFVVVNLWHSNVYIYWCDWMASKMCFFILFLLFYFVLLHISPSLSSSSSSSTNR